MSSKIMDMNSYKTSGTLLWIRYWNFGFHKMLGSSWVAAQLMAPLEGSVFLKYSENVLETWAQATDDRMEEGHWAAPHFPTGWSSSAYCIIHIIYFMVYEVDCIDKESKSHVFGADLKCLILSFSFLFWVALYLLQMQFYYCKDNRTTK
jgi:hypothetical protein